MDRAIRNRSRFRVSKIPPVTQTSRPFKTRQLRDPFLFFFFFFFFFFANSKLGFISQLQSLCRRLIDYRAFAAALRTNSSAPDWHPDRDHLHSRQIYISRHVHCPPCIPIIATSRRVFLSFDNSRGNQDLNRRKCGGLRVSASVTLTLVNTNRQSRRNPFTMTMMPHVR